MIEVGARVEHVREPGFPGTVLAVDDPGLDTECAMVLWDDSPEPSPCWTNKLCLSEDETVAPG